MALQNVIDYVGPKCPSKILHRALFLKTYLRNPQAYHPRAWKRIASVLQDVNKSARPQTHYFASLNPFPPHL